MRIDATPRVASEGRQLASELLSVVSRETRNRAVEEAGDGDGAGRVESAGPAATSGVGQGDLLARDRVAQEQIGVACASLRAVRESARRLELVTGQDASASPGAGLASGQHRRDREEHLIDESARRALASECGPPSHSRARDREAGVQLLDRRRPGRADLRGRAHVLDLRAGARAGSPRTPVRIATRESGSRRIGMSSGSASRPETMHAIGSGASPRSSRSSRNEASRRIRP